MQYSAASCQVTNGNPNVYKNGHLQTWAGVKPGALFGVQGEGVFYTVQQLIGTNQVVLTAPYRGVTNSTALYVICNDFTTNLKLPIINRGDLETAAIFDYCMTKLESTFQGAPGDMFKAVYDQNYNGIVDAAETVPWTGIIGAPATFPPALHALQHLDNGTDPIPVVTAARTGLTPKLSGVAGQYLNGLGNYADPTSILSANFMAKATYDTNNNGVVDTCDSLAWGSLTSVPTSFAPSLHAPAHLDNGSDPIPAATTSRMGLMPILTGVVTQFLNGQGGFTIPTGQPLTIMGTVSTASALPATGSVGQIWIASDTSHAWSWNGTTWVDCGKVTTGATGPQGNPGPTGQAAYTTTTVGFTVPAVGSTVVVTMTNASWMTVGEFVYVAGAAGGGNAACLQVFAKSANSVTLLNPAPTTGVAGPPGPPGQNGAPGLTWRGNWAAGSHYNPGDSVFYAGDSYIAVNTSVNDPPPSANWNYLTQGTLWFNGSGPPPTTIPGAAVGDYYLDVTTGNVYVLS